MPSRQKLPRYLLSLQILSHPGRHSSLHGSVHLLHWRTSLIWKSVKLCSLEMKVTKINIDASTVSTISARSNKYYSRQYKRRTRKERTWTAAPRPRATTSSGFTVTWALVQSASESKMTAPSLLSQHLACLSKDLCLHLS